MEAIRRNQARLRGTLCLIALRRWQLEQPAASPPDLATLVEAAGIPSVPIDPYSGQPMRLTSVAEKPVIYSVGPDGKDDKAQIESKPHTGDPGDFVYKLSTR
jgi:hypothetical protein